MWEKSISLCGTLSNSSVFSQPDYGPGCKRESKEGEGMWNHVVAVSFHCLIPRLLLFFSFWTMFKFCLPNYPESNYHFKTNLREKGCSPGSIGQISEARTNSLARSIPRTYAKFKQMLCLVYLFVFVWSTLDHHVFTSSNVLLCPTLSCIILLARPTSHTTKLLLLWIIIATEHGEKDRQISLSEMGWKFDIVSKQKYVWKNDLQNLFYSTDTSKGERKEKEDRIKAHSKMLLQYIADVNPGMHFMSSCDTEFHFKH